MNLTYTAQITFGVIGLVVCMILSGSSANITATLTLLQLEA